MSDSQSKGEEQQQTTKLTQLPPELLSHIYTYFDSAQSIGRLAQTSEVLNDFAQEQGWKTFVRTQYPYRDIPTDFEDESEAAHGLTTLFRNINRKAFISRTVEPPQNGHVVDAATGNSIRRWQRPSGQTMGYQPSIDSYEAWHDTEPGYGKDWASRRQVLAWSAGSQLVIRKQDSGNRGAELRREQQREGVENSNAESVDDFGQPTAWYTWRHPDSREGIDDITSVKLLKPQHNSIAGLCGENILVGTASGRLHLINGLNESESDNGSQKLELRQEYQTQDKLVRELDISSSESAQHAAASLSDERLALYPLQSTDISIPAVSEVYPASNDKRDSRIWSTKFLSNHQVAVGLGPSETPIRIYDITSTGFIPEAARTFSIGRSPYDHRVDVQDPYAPPTPTVVPNTNDSGRPRTSSVYPIAVLPSCTSASHHAEGTLFLSGGYDGIIRLHDLRSPDSHVSTYHDPADDASIYSLQPIGRDTLIAGSSRYSMLKVFDLRYSEQGGNRGGAGWNLFLNPTNVKMANTFNRRARNSPVYSLSSPSTSSPVLFAGVEGTVIQLDFVSVMDPHPDPLYKAAVVRMPGKKQKNMINVKQTWNANGNVLNFAMHERGGKNRLLKQRSPNWYGKEVGKNKGWREIDERWDLDDGNARGARRWDIR